MLSFVLKSLPAQFILTRRSSKFYLQRSPLQQIIQPQNTFSSSKSIDFSKVPILCEDDLEETFVRGSGPGGQAVNKTSNCVVLRHKPTNIIVKCHMHRAASANRKEARKILISKLDALQNGEQSIENQLKAIKEKKNSNEVRKRKKLNDKKEKWKQRESELLEEK